MATNPHSASTISQDWRELYAAALVETDKQKLLLRIAEAEKALTRRARELFTTPGENSAEGLDVEKALNMLSALRWLLGSET